MIKTTSDLPQKSSAIFGYLRLSSKIFGNLRKFSEIVLKRPCGLRTIFVESSEVFGKWSEIFGKSSKTSLSVCPYNKQNNTWLLIDMEYLFSCSTLHRVEHSQIYSISTHAHVLSIYIRHKNRYRKIYTRHLWH